MLFFGHPVTAFFSRCQWTRPIETLRPIPFPSLSCPPCCPFIWYGYFVQRVDARRLSLFLDSLVTLARNDMRAYTDDVLFARASNTSKDLDTA